MRQSKRHAKPTAAALLARVYRRQIDIDKEVAALADMQTALHRVLLDKVTSLAIRIETLVSGQRMLSERMESFRVLADHCARLLREKETLQKRVEAMQAMKDSALYMSKPLMIPTLAAKETITSILNEKTCRFAHLHRPNIRCGICGHLEISEDNYNPAWHRPEGT